MVHFLIRKWYTFKLVYTIRFSIYHLWIVCRLFFVEYAYILILS